MKVVNLFLSVFLIISITACSGSKKQVATVEEKNAPETAQSKKMTEPVAVNVDHLRKDMNEVIARFETKDSIYASIRRTPCYGRCPIYEATIYKSGLVIYDGNRFVDKIGKHYSRLTTDQLNEIVAKANEIEYFQMEDKYDSPVTDFPTTTTVLNASGKSKTISNRVGGPKSLKEYEKFLDELLNSLSWTKMSDNNQ